MIKRMNNLVIAVSTESSAGLLGKYADVILLDKDTVESKDTFYDTLYIRSHFAEQDTLPQNFRKEINSLVQQTKRVNPKVKIIDNMDNVDEIIAFEDKWLQYNIFGSFMPYTKLFDRQLSISDFRRPIYKNRLSSNGSGVTCDREKALTSFGDWVVQESLGIQEELRVYVIFGHVFTIGVVRQSMTENSKAQGVSARELTDDEVQFSLSVMEKAPDLEIVGLDIARTTSGELRLIEVNRSPGFAKFYELTGVNLAKNLYEILG